MTSLKVSSIALKWIGFCSAFVVFDLVANWAASRIRWILSRNDSPPFEWCPYMNWRTLFSQFVSSLPGQDPQALCQARLTLPLTKHVLLPTQKLHFFLIMIFSKIDLVQVRLVASCTSGTTFLFPLFFRQDLQGSYQSIQSRLGTSLVSPAPQGYFPLCLWHVNLYRLYHQLY